MTKIENDEKLLKDFFTANKQEIADNGFSPIVAIGWHASGTLPWWLRALCFSFGWAAWKLLGEQSEKCS